MNEIDRRRAVDRLLSALLDLDPEARANRLAAIADEGLRAEVHQMLELALEEGDALVPGGAVTPDLLAAVAAGGDPFEDREGQVLGPYRLLELVGRGGMGVVYLADRIDGHFDRQVAIKVIRRDLPVDRDRFQRERQILADLVHPGIARLYDGGVTPEGEPYFVLEYVDGEPIDAYCESRALGLRQRVELLIEVCDAVDAAHQHLVVHRDLKPSNLLVDRKGRPRLLDFGIAKVQGKRAASGPSSDDRSGAGEESPSPELTDDRVPMTLQYATPEQLRGEAVTVASDVYQLGLISYQLVANRRAWDLRGLDLEVALARLETSPPPPPSRVSGRTPGGGLSVRDLDAVILKALAPDPTNRHPTVAHLREDLERVLARQPVSPLARKTGYRALRFVQRHPVGIGATALAVLLLLVMAAAFTWRLARERDATRAEARQSAEVLEFVTTLFRQAGPERGGGPDTTVRELLDHGAERIQSRLADQPLTRARILTEIGGMYEVLGLYDEAQPLLDQGWELRKEQMEGPPDGVEELELAHSLLHLGRLDYRLGNLVEAEERLSRALEIYSTAGRPRDTAVVLSNLGNVQKSLGRYDAAADSLERALDLYGALDDAVGNAAARVNLANVLVHLERRSEARTLLESALSQYQSLTGPDHVGVATALNNLAILLSDEGKSEEAIELYQTALETYRSVYGLHHATVAQALTNLGNAHGRLGRQDEAKRYLEEALEVFRQVADTHYQQGVILMNLGVAEFRAEEYVRAELYYRQALEVLRGHLPDRHREIGITLANLGEALLLQGRPEEAEPLLWQSQETFVEIVGEEHFLVSLPTLFLARIAADRGDHEQAGELFARTVELRQAAEGLDPAMVEEAVAAFEAFQNRE